MRAGYAACSPPAAPGRAPLARVCTADCIKHKQLYLIGLYPALIITNSQTRSAPPPLCRTNMAKAPHLGGEG